MVEEEAILLGPLIHLHQVIEEEYQVHLDHVPNLEEKEEEIKEIDDADLLALLVALVHLLHHIVGDIHVLHRQNIWVENQALVI